MRPRNAVPSSTHATNARPGGIENTASVVPAGASRVPTTSVGPPFTGRRSMLVASPGFATAMCTPSARATTSCTANSAASTLITHDVQDVRGRGGAPVRRRDGGDDANAGDRDGDTDDQHDAAHRRTIAPRDTRRPARSPQRVLAPQRPPTGDDHFSCTAAPCLSVGLPPTTGDYRRPLGGAAARWHTRYGTRLKRPSWRELIEGCLIGPAVPRHQLACCACATSAGWSDVQHERVRHHRGRVPGLSPSRVSVHHARYGSEAKAAKQAMARADEAGSATARVGTRGRLSTRRSRYWLPTPSKLSRWGAWS